MRVAKDVPFASDPLGHEVRTGYGLSIAVHPRESSKVYVAWADRIDGHKVHVRRSSDRGSTWSEIHTIEDAVCFSLAVADSGTVGLLYQRYIGPEDLWVTKLEQTRDDFSSDPFTTTLSRAPASKPEPGENSIPYLGDYGALLAVGKEFRGVFSANNTPDKGNFPDHVARYQRYADFDAVEVAKKLTTADGAFVPVSIDPFYFSVGILE